MVLPVILDGIMVSKNMALYYMTDEEKYLKEFLRLAFPDITAIKEIEEYDGERIENKKDPLAVPYHYSANMMILLWDLIEESPLLSDEERLNITNAFDVSFRTGLLKVFTEERELLK